MGQHLFAQDAVKDLTAVYENYVKLKYYEMNMAIAYYDQSNSLIPSKQDVAKIVKNGNNYYFSMGKQEVIQKDKHVLIIDNEEESIYYFSEGNSNQRQSTDQYKLMLEKLMKQKLTLIGETNGERTYSYKVNQDMILSMDMTIDIKNNKLVKVITYYNQKEANSREEEIPYKVVVEYKVNDHQVPAANWFDLNKYINISNNNVSLTKAYSRFALINNEE